MVTFILCEFYLNWKIAKNCSSSLISCLYKVHSVILCLNFREGQESLGINRSEYCEQMGLSNTHSCCSRSDAGFRFGGLSFPLPVRGRETPTSSHQEPCAFSSRGQIHMSPLLPGPGAPGLPTEWEIAQLRARCGSKTLRPKVHPGRHPSVLTELRLPGSAITHLPVERAPALSFPVYPPGSWSVFVMTPFLRACHIQSSIMLWVGF